MNYLAKNFKQITSKYPITRGMITYAISWSTSAFVQQTVEAKRKYDWWRILRFGLFGSLFNAPSFYCWIKLSTAMYPGTNLKVAIIKAYVESFAYSPLSTFGFYYVMTLLEGGGHDAAILEVTQKFIPTYRISVTIWPPIGIINYAFVPEKNRVVFISTCSFIWVMFLAYMKRLNNMKTAPKLLRYELYTELKNRMKLQSSKRKS